ncbi:hypothetical protein BN1723_011619 [Verticillium longisporum]|uniref:V-SNARE coiled-coil homology domain-containing protein n=1 Tax=Verticillium longisporum TaxID=100787 RepID=A0A0G4LA14_VERLO|nr:hypothetical protein BN1723_011619 [Verticillium longisporum]
MPIPTSADPDDNRLILTPFPQVIRNQEKPAHELVSEKELSAYSRFTKNNYGEFMTLFSKTIAERTAPGQRQSVEEQDYTFHALGRSEGICGIVDEFLAKHPRSTWSAGSPTLAFPELKDYLSKYQDPQQADSILKIQKELDETKIVLHKTIESVLQRGEKIDDLVAKSDGLSSQSKMFYQLMLRADVEIAEGRGEKIDDLVAKSDGLSSQSKMFYRENGHIRRGKGGGGDGPRSHV